LKTIPDGSKRAFFTRFPRFYTATDMNTSPEDFLAGGNSYEDQ